MMDRIIYTADGINSFDNNITPIDEAFASYLRSIGWPLCLDNSQSQQLVYNIPTVPQQQFQQHVVPLTNFEVDLTYQTPQIQSAISDVYQYQFQAQSLQQPIQFDNTPLVDHSSVDDFLFPEFAGLDMPNTTLISELPLAGSSPIMTHSPATSNFEICSLSSSDDSWTAINHVNQQTALTEDVLPCTIFNPGETLHLRKESTSTCSIDSLFEDIGDNLCLPVMDTPTLFPLALPEPESRTGSCSSDELVPSQAGSASPPSTKSKPVTRRRRSPTDLSTSPKASKVIKKKTLDANAVQKSSTSQRRVGCRKGPLRPEQRQQAHEIRKKRACLRCKFLKKTCDTGDPCAGCRPSHARLWQVPCTRVDIRDLGTFLNDFKADFCKKSSLFENLLVHSFDEVDMTLYITHGFGFFLPVPAREVVVTNQKCLRVKWVEGAEKKRYKAKTASLSVGHSGIDIIKLAEYIDMHLNNDFEGFITSYFCGTPFVTEILQTVYRYYVKTQNEFIRTALRLFLTYTLTVSITMVEGLPEPDQSLGRVSDRGSRFFGQTPAPGMINYEIKSALAKLWRDLQKEVLEDLSSLYSSVYQGDKLRHWPTIFMVATILLVIWEMMQYDMHYREKDSEKVEKFCHDMESTPVGVIVGLFQAISQKLPTFPEWSTEKHGQSLNNDVPICEALTEVRQHIEKHGELLIILMSSFMTNFSFQNRGVSQDAIRSQIHSW